VGWFIVTVVGFLTAIVAFLIVRSEQWLFDLKDGYCHDDWKRAKIFCCPHTSVSLDLILHLAPDEKPCDAWITWGDVFGPSAPAELRMFVQYIVFALIAVSCLSHSRVTSSNILAARSSSL
jgi:chloride channel 3/4/5